MKRYRLNPKRPRQLIKEEQERLDKARIGYSDIPPLGNGFFTKAMEAWPPTKKQLTIRLDSDVLKWLKAFGRGYQTRINRILRAAMESQGTKAKRPMRAGSTGRAARKARGPRRS